MPLGGLVNAWRDTHRIGAGEDGGAGNSNVAKLQGSLSRGGTNVLSKWHPNDVKDDFAIRIATASREVGRPAPVSPL
jgi:hypothetical protein